MPPREPAEHGAAAHVTVEGEWNNDLLEQIEKTGPIDQRNARSSITRSASGGMDPTGG